MQRHPHYRVPHHPNATRVCGLILAQLRRFPTPHSECGATIFDGLDCFCTSSLGCIVSNPTLVTNPGPKFPHLTAPQIANVALHMTTQWVE